ncbi:MAG TPA: PIG-L deacetylase family protein [Chitinophagaceae bacterium]|nr:PIG-L deacetylase family protein [Chitinophagaceae bacterium]
MLNFPFITKKSGYSILCMGAHCDDIEIGCGGSLLNLLETHPVDFVQWVVFASDEERKQEAITSANAFLKNAKEKEILVFDYRDAFLNYSGMEIKEKFESIKKEIDPDLIFTHYRDDRHQDHKLLSDFTWNTFRQHLILEYEIPKFDGDLGMPNFFVRLNEEQANKKTQIIMDSFKSQAGKHWFDKETFQALMRIRGMESACMTKYAEAFYARKMIL